MAAVGAVVAASALLTAAPAWSGPPADANVIVDLSVIDGLNAGAPSAAPMASHRTAGQPLPPSGVAPKSQLHWGATPASRAEAAIAGGPAQSGQSYGRLKPVWPPRTIAEIRDRTVTPVNLLTRRAASLLAHVEPQPRTPGRSVGGHKAVDTARLFPPPQVQSASLPLQAGAFHARASSAGGDRAYAFPPPAPMATADLASAAIGSGAMSASAWRPAPTAKPADGQQVAILSPATPPTKPHEEVALRPMPRPAERHARRSGARSGETATRRLEMIYAANGIEIPSPVRSELASLARDVKPVQDMRIQLAAYAGSRDDSASKARRTSLSRALAVRGFLIDHGIAAGRIDVRALGNASPSGEADRVDVVVLDK